MEKAPARHGREKGVCALCIYNFTAANLTEMHILGVMYISWLQVYSSRSIVRGMYGQMGETLRNPNKSRFSKLGATLFDAVLTQPSSPNFFVGWFTGARVVGHTWPLWLDQVKKRSPSHFEVSN